MSSRNEGWALWRGLRGVSGHFVEGWRELPPAAWRGWLVTLAVGMAVAALVTYGLTIGAMAFADQGLNEWDRDWLLRMESDGVMEYNEGIWWQTFGTSAMLIPLVAVAAVIAAQLRRPLLALSFLGAYLLQKPLVFLGWGTWDRARPTLIEGGIAAPPLHSYPSGHVVQTVAIFGLLAYLWIRRSGSWIERIIAVALWLAMSVIVGVARLRLGAHWPSDTIAGFVIGLVLLGTLIAALAAADRAGRRAPGATAEAL